MGPERPELHPKTAINTAEAPFVQTRMSNPSDLQRHSCAGQCWSFKLLVCLDYIHIISYNIAIILTSTVALSYYILYIINQLKVTTWRLSDSSKFTKLHVPPASKTIPTIYHKMCGRIQRQGTPKNGFIRELLPIVLRCTRFCFTPD